MSNLNVDPKTIISLFGERKNEFLIPDYQRPYAWEETECQTLWEDLFAFAFPDNDKDKFNSSKDEYYLGPIVTFKNNDGKLEVIDGQQRITSIMLLLRAFYSRFGKMRDSNSVETAKNISVCIWKTNEFGQPNTEVLKIDSKVATDNVKNEFLSILKTGEAPSEMKSRYAVNYRFFQEMIGKFLDEFPSYFPYLPTRILNNCILLPIEADSQDTALRIFSTLNDRGLPLSDADIFKAKFYDYYSSKNLTNDFIKRWKELSELCETIFHPITGTPMDELFTRYMYYLRAKKGIKRSTTEALRKFYEGENRQYDLLKNENALDDLTILAKFWDDVYKQNSNIFSSQVLKQLFILNYAPNNMWTFFVSVYFMHNKDIDGKIENEAFFVFLQKITAFILAYNIINPGVNALRTPVFAEMVNIVNNTPVSFKDYLFDALQVKIAINNYNFFNGRPITKSMLVWWAFTNEEQEVPDLETVFEIEHIFSRNRQELEKTLKDSKNLDLLGNKAILEKRINIRASDYHFIDKKKYYTGFITDKHQEKAGTINKELKELAISNDDFAEDDIEKRNNEIINGFIQYLKDNNLLK